MISQTQQPTQPAGTGWNWFKSAAKAASNVFDLQGENVNEFSLKTRPGLFANFSNEIRMLQYTLGGLVKEQTPVQEVLMKFALDLIEKARIPDQKNPEDEVTYVKQVIGMLIFVAERDINNLIEVVENRNNYVPWIKNFFTTHLAIPNYEIEINRTTQNISKIVPNKAGDVHAQTAIAKLVVTNSGVLNEAIAGMVIKGLPCLKELHSQVQENVYTYENLIHDIATNEQLLATFDGIQCPEDENSVVYDLIRCILGLKSDETVTHAHAKQAVLAAVMEVFCHRNFTSGERLHRHINHMMCFCSNLLRKGEGFSLANLPEELNFSEMFKIFPSGAIATESGILLGNHPEIAAAARQLGINDLNAIWEDLRKQIFGDNPTPNMISIQEFIGELVEYVINKNPSFHGEEEQLMQLGKLAFSSVQSNVLVALTKEFMKKEKQRLSAIVNQVAIRRIFAVSRPIPFDIKELTIDEAVQKLAAHSKAIANSNVNEDMRLNMFEFIYVNMIPEGIQADFQSIVRDYDRSILQKFQQHPVSVKEYALKILELANDLTGASPKQRYENQKALTCYLLCKGLDEKLREGFWDLILKMKIDHPLYKALKFDFYLMFDPLTDQLVRLSANDNRTQVEILEYSEWDNVASTL